MIKKHEAPISAQDLKARLREGLVEFSFVKKDGVLRRAVGTTNLRQIPADQHPKGVREASPKQVCFWDLLTGEWRSVSIESLIFSNDQVEQV